LNRGNANSVYEDFTSLMRNDLHTSRATIVAAVIFAVTLLLLLPAITVLSIERTNADAAGADERVRPASSSFIVSRVAPAELAATEAATPALPTARAIGGQSTEQAAQSASMLLAGALLIGVGSFVRKAVAS
jgi:hypothetical protein